MSAVIVILACVVVFQTVVIATSSHRAQRRQDSAIALERARQDLLLNRLASRTLPEYAAATAVMNEAPRSADRGPTPSYLYDATGLIQSVEYPDDEERDDG